MNIKRPAVDTLAEELFAELIDEIAELMQRGDYVDLRVYRLRVEDRWLEFESIVGRRSTIGRLPSGELTSHKAYSVLTNRESSIET